MAKTSQIERNRKRERMAQQWAARREALRAQVSSADTPLEARFEAAMKLAQTPRNASWTRVRRRCGLTGRARGYHRRFGVSRIMLRELASSGLLPGVVKSSW